MSICIRYTKHLEMKERFIGFVNVSYSQTSNALFSSIIDLLNLYNLNNIPIIGQSFDGANIMSGQKGGVQTKHKQNYPYAIYIHCMAHKLILVIVDTCEYSKAILLFIINFKNILFFISIIIYIMFNKCYYIHCIYKLLYYKLCT